MTYPTIYIAGSSREIPRVRDAMAQAASAGYRVEHDWTQPIEERTARGLTDADMSINDRAEFATLDCRAIRAADLFWLLAPETPSTGAWWELGYAAGIGKTPIVSGACRDVCLFVALELSFATDHAAIEWLVWRAEREVVSHG